MRGRSGVSHSIYIVIPLSRGTSRVLPAMSTTSLQTTLYRDYLVPVLSRLVHFPHVSYVLFDRPSLVGPPSGYLSLTPGLKPYHPRPLVQHLHMQYLQQHPHCLWQHVRTSPCRIHLGHCQLWLTAVLAIPSLPLPAVRSPDCALNLPLHHHLSRPRYINRLVLLRQSMYPLHYCQWRTTGSSKSPSTSSMRTTSATVAQ